MALYMKPEEKVFVRISYTGYIPVINACGPFNLVAITKTELKELIRRGYDVNMRCREADPQLYDIVQLYRKAMLDDDKETIGKLQKELFSKNPGSVTEEAMKKADKPRKTPATETTTDPATAFLKAQGIQNPSEAAAAGTDTVPPVAQIGTNVTTQIEGLVDGRGIGEGAALDEFAGAFPTNPLQPESTTVSAGNDGPVNPFKEALDNVEDSVNTEPPVEQPVEPPTVAGRTNNGVTVNAPKKKR
jgi:hypothetical protein